MLIYFFCDGARWGSWDDDHEGTFEIGALRREAENSKANLCETQIIIPLHNPKTKPKLKHSLQDRERTEPNMTFFAGILTDEYYHQVKVAGVEWKKRQLELRGLARNFKPLAKRKVYWNDLLPKQQARLKGADLTISECWIWNPLKNLRRKEDRDHDSDQAPYRDFYAQVKGPIPAGVLLRHKCDNRQCMNPNHLWPGTHKDNTQDMMKRGRHPTQIAAREAANRREIYLRRKQRSDRS